MKAFMKAVIRSCDAARKLPTGTADRARAAVGAIHLGSIHLGAKVISAALIKSPIDSRTCNRMARTLAVRSATSCASNEP